MIGLAFAAALLAQDPQAWAQALARFQKLSASRDPLDRAAAARGLGAATSEKTDRLCWALVSGLLRQELAKEGPGGKSEEKVSGDVLQGCLDAFRRLASKEAVAEMTKTARAKGEVPRLRCYAVWGLAKSGAIKDLMELVDDRLLMVSLAAVDALAERADPASLPLLLRLAGEDRTWEVKLQALRGLEKAGTEETVGPLIELLGRFRADEGRLKDQVLAALRKLTGVEILSDDPNAWKAAWTAKKAGQEPAEGQTIAEPTEFYGLRTRSTRIVFVLDRTGSMMAPGSEPARSVFKLPAETVGGEKEPPAEKAAREECARIQKRWAERKAATRMDVAKKELIGTVYVLHPKVHFNVVWYESVPKPWKPELVPASWPNKLDCLKEADRLEASGPTNIWDALEMAFKMLEAGSRRDVVALDKKANYATSLGGADTFFLMTDGQPNEGRIADPAEILSELRKVNQLRKVTVHTVCVGDPVAGGDPKAGPDPVFLKKLAEENGGDFVHIQK
jgi:HEAT repeat protein